MPKYKAVIFDFDDTLVESRLAKWDQHKHVGKKFYNIDLKDETLHEHWGKPIHILAPELYEHSEPWEEMHQKLISTKKDFPKKLYPGSVTALNELLDNSIKIGIISAATRMDITEDLVKFNFPLERFTIIQGCDETNVHKPNPEVFTPALKKLEEEGIELKDILYVGDSIDDLKASTLAGIDFIALTTGLYTREDFKKLGAKTILKNIGELTKEIL